MLWMMTTALAAVPGTPCNFHGPKGGYFGRALLEYVSGDRAKTEEAKHAAAELRDPRPTPARGYVRITVERPILELADTSNYVLVVLRDFAEVARQAPEPSPTTVAKGKVLGALWWNDLRQDLPDEPGMVTVRLADKSSAGVCAWSVDDVGKVAVVK